MLRGALVRYTYRNRESDNCKSDKTRPMKPAALESLLSSMRCDRPMIRQFSVEYLPAAMLAQYFASCYSYWCVCSRSPPSSCSTSSVHRNVHSSFYACVNEPTILINKRKHSYRMTWTRTEWILTFLVYRSWRCLVYCRSTLPSAPRLFFGTAGKNNRYVLRPLAQWCSGSYLFCDSKDIWPNTWCICCVASDYSYPSLWPLLLLSHLSHRRQAFSPAVQLTLPRPSFASAYFVCTIVNVSNRIRFWLLFHLKWSQRQPLASHRHRISAVCHVDRNMIISLDGDTANITQMHSTTYNICIVYNKLPTHPIHLRHYLTWIARFDKERNKNDQNGVDKITKLQRATARQKRAKNLLKIFTTGTQRNRKKMENCLNDRLNLNIEFLFFFL